MLHLYGLFIGLAVVVGWSVAERIEPKVSKVAPWVLGLGLLGARMWHVVDMWSYYARDLSQVVAVWNGGLSIWGGLIGGYVAFKITNYKLQITNIDQVSMLGSIVTGLPLAQAIGRVGNGVNGEFVNKVWILPWWGAEAALDLGLFGLIWRMRRIWPVGVIWVYLGGYLFIRLVLQSYRL